MSILHKESSTDAKRITISAPPHPETSDHQLSNHSNERQEITDKSIKYRSKDEETLAKLGYKSEFEREYGYLGSISFAFSIVGLSSCITSTFNTPMMSGGPACVVWCWLIGSVMCSTIAASVAELVSAYPTSGGLYSASAFLVPKRYKAPVGFLVGWLSVLGQIAGVASPEFALSQMIWSAYSLSQDGKYSASKIEVVGVFAILLVIHGFINSLATKAMAKITKCFIFFNFGATFMIIIALCASGPPRNSFDSIFSTVINQTGWESTPLAFMMGFLSVEWTLSDYDASAHITEEMKRPAVAAPLAIITAVGVTGILGWFFNVALVLYAPEMSQLPGPSGLSVATILYSNLSPPVFYVAWSLICLNAFFQVNTVLQACSRTMFAFSRDGGMPDRGLFGRLTKSKIPLNAVWFIVLISLGLGSLDFASSVAVNAVFSLTTIALDNSYAIPIAMKMLFRNHPEVKFEKGPMNLGDGFLMWLINSTAVTWVLFVSIILAFPMVKPITAENMNYSSIIMVLVIILSSLWYFSHAHNWYKGPRSNIHS
ncbi:amino acid/polyamine transporter I [Phakopsora pachyrhizi]|uniref:Amino acid/polyamine transporter I n=1 Tax=Phakopsora pachyrhizi TaxID=170000 RepID=A0AAV0BGJ0_PHAPC|nr:amino acid/polyamine transporter I [Phakopsora pachyrhizi]CAH7685013.1 amino acid/polyamine transporter I [Phakopsora pachyrhizi]